ncbi:MAG: glycosyltransferase [Intrasporangium sp.]|uniref:glycosyltransferase n=1 Tax=Intrasporangium sp. TaxID=1925024 RepID=UPI00264A379F|nr:glycosyltransferase [Intrasporangium sp.]MDN5794480.1 glycosyltransferase [Intrasporangium sp.]
MRGRPTVGDERAGQGPGSTGIRRIALVGIEHSRLGGVAGFMNTLANGLLGRGYEVEIIGLQPSSPGNAYAFERDPGITVRTIQESIPPDWVRLDRLDRLNPRKVAAARRWQRTRDRGVAKLRPIVSGWGPETLIICTQIQGMEYLVPAGLEPGNPQGPYVIAQYHGSRQMSVAVGSVRRLRRWCANADRFLALTPTDAEEFRIRDQLNNTGFIYNPVPRQRHGPAQREDVVVSLNRYDEQKSLDWLLRAWAVVSPDFPQWRLRLYGEGPLRDELAVLIHELGVSGTATLEGITSDPESVLRRAKIYALSSQDEGLPLTIVEAAVAGVPTVSFDCAPGIRDLIDDGVNGVVVPKNHVSGLVTGLRQLMADDALRERLGVRAEQDSGRFALDTVLDRWEDEMRELTGRSTPRPAVV